MKQFPWICVANQKAVEIHLVTRLYKVTASSQTYISINMRTS